MKTLKSLMLTYGKERDHFVFPRVNRLVIRPVAPHVCSAVDQPGGVKHTSISEESREEVCYGQGFPPEVPGHHRGYGKAHKQYRYQVVPVNTELRAVLTYAHYILFTQLEKRDILA